MNISGPLRISEGPFVFAERDRRRARASVDFETDVSVRKELSVLGVLRVTSTIARLSDTSGCFYEVVAHREQTVRDDRCIVARFRRIEDAHAAVSGLASCWAHSYVPPEIENRRSIAPCQN